MSMPEPEKKSRPKPAVIAAIIVAALIAIMMGFFWYELQKQDQKLAEFRQQMEADQRAQNHLLEQTRLDEQQLKELMEEQLALFESRLEKLSSADRSDWLLGEAEYLLRLAHHYAVLAKDAKAAEMLLANADDVMKEYERQHAVNTAVTGIRRHIANERSQLRLYDEFDREGLYLRLESLIETIDAIPVVDIQSLAPTKSDAEITEPGDQAAGSTLWKSFRRMTEKAGVYIRIRQHKKEPGALLSPDEQRYMKQNLRFRLEQAQLAILQQRQAVYKVSLSDAKNWIDRYYVINQEQKKKILKELNELSGHNVDQSMPDMNASLEALRQYIQKRRPARRQ